MRPRVLVPFDRREALTLAEAAEIAGKSISTVRNWCAVHDIGRRVAGGPWQISRIALAMFLDGDGIALEKYLAGDRETDVVRNYFRRAGLN